MTMDQTFHDAFVFLTGNDKIPGIDPRDQQRDLLTQLGISAALGTVAFLTFTVLRPRWSDLYAARKKKIPIAFSLPDLPDNLFGWIPIVYRITEQEVLRAAGLDAYVFLQFFKMAIKFLAIAALLCFTVLYPIHSRYSKHEIPPINSTATSFPNILSAKTGQIVFRVGSDSDPENREPWLWIYVIFVYLFSGLAIWFLYTYSLKITHVRQAYLGHQSTVTDRTIRLSGIPRELRTEEAIKNHIQAMGIGEVQSVTLCRKWKELDDLMAERNKLLRKLEEAESVLLNKQRVQRNLETLPIAQPSSPSPRLRQDGSEEPLLPSPVGFEERRPTLTITKGPFWLWRDKVDAIDYLKMKLEVLDAKIQAARKKEYPPTAMSFVTLDSVAAAQMGMQAVLDPKPGNFIAHPAPAPSVIIWRNTYMSRWQRMLRSWTISIFIFVLSVVWLIPVAFLAGLLNTKSIRKVWPELADLLDASPIGRTLMQNFVPTAALTGLNMAVPYLYDYLSNFQGSLSQSDVELSVISKNFFFTFFNLFLAFSVFGTASNLYSVLRDSLKDTTMIAYLLAKSLEGLAPFYTNLIVLQGIGVFPFRLLELGEVLLYPIYRMGAKTPRDYAEISKPPIFSYGIYLPQPILIFILCIVYSVLPSGAFICGFGLIYFLIGYFISKYQLLYAMDHPHHSTGQAWPMIVYRVIIGLIVFQLAIAGVLALKTAFTRAALVTPLLPLTLWFTWYYRKIFAPLNQYIALKAVRKYTQAVNGSSQEIDIVGPTVDEQREHGVQFINPSLVAPLTKPWITAS